MLSDKYLWLVPELTLVHEVYKLASSQEPVTIRVFSRAEDTGYHGGGYEDYPLHHCHQNGCCVLGECRGGVTKQKMKELRWLMYLLIHGGHGVVGCVAQREHRCISDKDKGSVVRAWVASCMQWHNHIISDYHNSDQIQTASGQLSGERRQTPMDSDLLRSARRRFSLGMTSGTCWCQ
jgi:hypothetical protein